MGSRQVFLRRFKSDMFAKSPQHCHCEECSDEAIPKNQPVTMVGIASLRSQ